LDPDFTIELKLNEGLTVGWQLFEVISYVELTKKKKPNKKKSKSSKFAVKLINISNLSQFTVVKLRLSLSSHFW